jgi:hypothetical protein
MYFININYIFCSYLHCELLHEKQPIAAKDDQAKELPLLVRGFFLSHGRCRQGHANAQEHIV